MALLTWTQEFSVRVPSFDAQHQQLFDMINRLHDAMKSGRGNAIAPQILQELVNYTKEHFANEERVMRNTGYADYVSHRMEHDKLTRKVESMASDLKAGKLALSMDLLQFLRDWLQNHIARSDKRYGDHMIANRVQ